MITYQSSISTYIIWKTRSSAIAEGLCNALVSRNPATTKHNIGKRLQSTNDLEVCTPKVIAITLFT